MWLSLHLLLASQIFFLFVHNVFHDFIVFRFDGIGAGAFVYLGLMQPKVIAGEEALAAIFAFVLLFFGVTFHVVAVAGAWLQFLVAQCTLESKRQRNRGVKLKLVQRRVADVFSIYLECFAADVWVHVSRSHAACFIWFIANRALKWSFITGNGEQRQKIILIAIFTTGKKTRITALTCGIAYEWLARLVV